MSEFFNNNLCTISPPLSDNFWTDLVWLNTNLKNLPSGVSVTSAELTDFNGNGGLSGANMNKLVLTFSDGTSRKCVYKTTPAAGREAGSKYGLPREGIFYESFFQPLKTVGVSLSDTFLKQ